MTAFPASVVRLAAKDFSTKVLLPQPASSLWNLFFPCTALIGLGVSGDWSIKTCINENRDLKRYSPHVQYKIPGFQEAGVKRPTRAGDLSA
jgi:hypothetical protein